MTTQQIHAIDPAEAARLRASHTGPVIEVDASPGYPCRCCLRDAAVGDRVVLVSHDPFGGTSAYASSSPIWLHADGCEPHQPDAALPSMLLQRPLSLRAFDRDEMMLDYRIVEGDEVDRALGELLADAEVAAVHVHNAGPGCWNCEVRRAPAD